ncbi:MAG: hypothetical protein M3Y87_09715 [Myxococcota bacterium]|nr:hypothetical protein [Myxococcota bacterium]
MRARGIALAVVVAIAALGCGSESPRTQVMVIVQADSVVRAQTSTVTIEVRGRASAGSGWESTAASSFDIAATGWPIQVAIVPRDGDVSREWQAIAQARDARGMPIVEARAISGYAAGQTLSHTIFLEGACIGAAMCAEDETCVAGACTSARVPFDRLVPYVPPAPVDAGSMDAGDAGDAGPADAGDASTPDRDGGRDGGCLPPSDEVDLLLMIDNSNSMAEEQAALVAVLPAMVRALSSGDVEGDGIRDFLPIGSLQIGVVSSDMGAGGHDTPTCTSGTYGAMYGDDGELLTRGSRVASGCAVAYPPIFEFLAGASDVASFVRDVSCVAQLGVSGCGFEQQLEAVLKAIAPSAPQPWTAPGYVPIEFFGGTDGHGDGAHLGFVRAGSILAMLLVTDEEDCSASDLDLFDPGSTTYASTDLNLRCFRHPEAIHPVSRFIGGLGQMRQDPRRLVYAAIAGIPGPVDPGAAPADYGAILAHPDMVEAIDPTMTNRMRPSCSSANGIAFPPRRIVTVAQGLDDLGAATTVHSICQSSYDTAIRRIATLIGSRVDGSCR